MFAFSGESLRNTAKSLRLLGVQVTHRTVLNWIRKYVTLMEKYLDKITPQLSDTSSGRNVSEGEGESQVPLRPNGRPKHDFG